MYLNVYPTQKSGTGTVSVFKIEKVAILPVTADTLTPLLNAAA